MIIGHCKSFLKNFELNIWSTIADARKVTQLQILNTLLFLYCLFQNNPQRIFKENYHTIAKI